MVSTWKGETLSDASGEQPGPEAIERYDLDFDDPADPTEAVVTVHITPAITEQIVYSLDRDPASAKPRVRTINGGCPSCGLESNASLDYDDPDHPMRPTRTIDGKGTWTLSEYTSFGEVALRTDGANRSVPGLMPRTTEWTYAEPEFPAFVTSRSGPFFGAGGTRLETRTYSATGNLLAVTESGMEATYPSGTFALTTTYAGHNAAGNPDTIDPPPAGGADGTTFSYDVPGAGGFLISSRADPLVGTTTFFFNSFNRRIGVEDVNGVLLETRFDSMDRVTRVIHRSSPAAQVGDPLIAADLETHHFYDQVGDLVCTVFPQGNAVQRLVDQVTGRVSEIRRGEAVASPSAANCLDASSSARERIVFSYDLYGHRTVETHARDEAGGGDVWVDRASRRYDWVSRCHLDKVVQAPGRPEESEESFSYDCNGNLEKVWDPKHERAVFPGSPTTTYEFDDLDRVTAVRQRWGTPPPAEIVTRFGYDVQDHLTSVTDAEGNVTSYTYSDRDLLTGESSVASGMAVHVYDDHGELVESTDGRGIMGLRTLDDADRVVAIDYPGTEGDVTFTYGPATASDFSVGRLTSIARGGIGVNYAYDRFGRRLTDGALTHTFDENGNALTTTHPGGGVATMTYDFADRPITLAFNPGGGATTVASAGSYLPEGPLAAVALGSAPARVETRSFDFRYVPTASDVAGGLLHWDYTTDAAGQPTEVTQTSPASSARSFAYQELQEYLTCAAGPWSPAGSSCSPAPSGEPILWTYDRIGNRMSEQRGVQIDSYIYTPNAAVPAGHTAVLESILPGPRVYAFDDGGYLDLLDAAGNVVDLSWDAEGRLSASDRPSASERIDLRYDGRGFLAEASDLVLLADGFEDGRAACWSEARGGAVVGLCTQATAYARSVTATYDSDGRLRSLLRQPGLGFERERRDVLYLGDRPIALARTPVGGATSFTFLTTDHLGTPILALNASGESLWLGGFEPFGRDWQAGSPQGASENGVFLRLPGQWIDPIWDDATLGLGLYQNVHRWYEPGTGRYASVDPWQDPVEARPLYAYVSNQPLTLTDPLGLRQFPFGAGQFCRDPSCRCPTWPPVKVLGEDDPTFSPTMQSGCVDADAAYTPGCILKVPDNYSCVLKCGPQGSVGQETITCRPKGFFLGIAAHVFLHKKPECLPTPALGWPANPF